MMTDLYAHNGFILRHHALDDTVSELELKFPTTGRQDALIYSLTLVYLALFQRQIPFVASSPTLLAFAVRTADLDEPTRAALVAAVARVQRHVTTLFADAEIYFHGRRDKGVLPTDPDHLLASYQQAEVIGQAFLEHFARDMAERPGPG